MNNEERKKQLSTESKKIIINAYDKGNNVSVISNIFEVDKKTIYRIIKKYNDEMIFERKKGTGLQTKYDIDDVKDKIIEIIKKIKVLHYIILN